VSVPVQDGGEELVDVLDEEVELEDAVNSG
jgi:hypothetical protein